LRIFGLRGPQQICRWRPARFEKADSTSRTPNHAEVAPKQPHPNRCGCTHRKRSRSTHCRQGKNHRRRMHEGAKPAKVCVKKGLPPVKVQRRKGQVWNAINVPPAGPTIPQDAGGQSRLAGITHGIRPVGHGPRPFRLVRCGAGTHKKHWPPRRPMDNQRLHLIRDIHVPNWPPSAAINATSARNGRVSSNSYRDLYVCARP